MLNCAEINLELCVNTNGIALELDQKLMTVLIVWCEVRTSSLEILYVVNNSCYFKLTKSAFRVVFLLLKSYTLHNIFSFGDFS